MTRRTIDLLLSWTGLVVAIVLLAAGGLLVYGSTFVTNQVRDQLSAQKIFFPAADSPAVKGAEFAAMRPYGGEQLTTGPQAETYANHFIAVHLQEVAAGKTYSEVSAAALADPKNAALQGQADALFRGTALRGLLLNAYAFWTVGRIAAVAAIVSFIGGGVLVVLSVIGFVRAGARRTGVERPAELDRRAEAPASKAA